MTAGLDIGVREMICCFFYERISPGTLFLEVSTSSSGLSTSVTYEHGVWGKRIRSFVFVDGPMIWSWVYVLFAFSYFSGLSVMPMPFASFDTQDMLGKPS